MLTAITYNCNPESLADVSQESFAEAFENEVRVKPIYRDLAINVTFDDAESGITAWSIASDNPDGDIDREGEFREEFRRFAEKAFAACLV